MKGIATVLSTAAIGFLLGSPSLSLLHELQRLVESRRRLMWAFVFGAAAFVFVISSILFGAFEAAVQYDEQGFLIWTSIFTLSASLFGAGVVCAIAGKLFLPKPAEPGLFAGFQHAPIQKLVEDLIGQFFEPPSEQRDSQRRSGPDRSEVADYGHPEYTTH